MVATASNTAHILCITPKRSYISEQGDNVSSTWRQMSESCVTLDTIYRRSLDNANPPTIWIQYRPDLIGILGQPVLYQLIEDNNDR